MFNQILWTLDNEIDGTKFEQLCTDLLGREGYIDIIPIGGNYDGGRDAEIRRFLGIKSTGGTVFFQYSLENKWEAKLKRELTKVKTNGHSIEFFVFVTTQKVTGRKRDSLRAEVRTQYGWNLIIYDREWFRHRLGDRYPDLAVKYCGVNEITVLNSSRSEVSISVPLADTHQRAWELYIQQEYEASTVELKRLVKVTNDDEKLWCLLAVCQYNLLRYDEALVSINRAIAIKGEPQFESLKACILTEDGIKRGSKTNLLLAKDIFRRLAETRSAWLDHYNYGNVLQELNEYNQAEEEFLKTVEGNPSHAEAWKNLGTVYFHLDDHLKELECYDKALHLSPKLPEALVSKAVTLLIVYKNPQEAITLLESALQDAEIGSRWPHAWYWLSKAYQDNGQLEMALKRATEGLNTVPDHYGLLNLKGSILAQLWPSVPSVINEAQDFFKLRVQLNKKDYDSFTELTHIYLASKQESAAIDLLLSFTENKLNFSRYQEFIPHPLDEILTAVKFESTYARFRKVSPITEYSLPLTNAGLKLDKDFEDTLYASCMIPFGLACSQIESLSPHERREQIDQIWELILNSIRESFPKLALKLLNEFKKESIKHSADTLTPIVIHWADFALVEVSRQIGYTCSIFGVDQQVLEHSTNNKGEKLSDWQIRVLADTLMLIDRKFQLFTKNEI